MDAQTRLPSTLGRLQKPITTRDGPDDLQTSRWSREAPARRWRKLLAKFIFCTRPLEPGEITPSPIDLKDSLPLISVYCSDTGFCCLTSHSMSRTYRYHMRCGLLLQHEHSGPALNLNISGWSRALETGRLALRTTPGRLMKLGPSPRSSPPKRRFLPGRNGYPRPCRRRVDLGTRETVHKHDARLGDTRHAVVVPSAQAIHGHAQAASLFAAERARFSPSLDLSADEAKASSHPYSPSPSASTSTLRGS